MNAVTLEEFLDHVNSGRLIEGGSEPHVFMHAASQEALRTLAELNSAYRSPGRGAGAAVPADRHGRWPSR